TPVAWRVKVEVELADQASEGQPAIPLNPYGRMRLQAAVLGRDGQAVLSDSFAGLCAAIPCLCRQRQQSDVMLLEHVILVHAAPPIGGCRTQMRGRDHAGLSHGWHLFSTGEPVVRTQ